MAERLYLEVLVRQPDHFEALLNLGLLARESGRLADAIERVEGAARAKPESAVVWNILGNLLRENHRTANAIDAYNRAVRNDPTYVNAHFNLGELLQNTGNADGAATCYRTVLTLSPDDTDARRGLGVALVETNRNEEAEACFRELIRLRPRDANAHHGLGRALSELGRLDDAEQAFRESIAIQPDNAQAYNDLGLVLNRQSRIEEAQSAFESAIRARPDYPLAHANLASILHMCHQFEAARAECCKALDIDPGFGLAHANLGTVLWSQGDLESAIDSFRQALSLDPERAEVAGNLAAVLEEMNRVEEAGVTATEALARSPLDPNLNLVAAKCERRGGHFEAATTRLERLDRTTVAPELGAKIEHELGLLHDRNGNFDRAFGHFEACNQLAARTYQACRFDGHRAMDKLDAMQSFLEGTSEFRFPDRGQGSNAPVFLVGFPRSGTTLLDQILDSHPGIQTLEEKPALDAVAAEIDQVPGGYPEALPRLDGDDIERLRGIYFSVVSRSVTLDSEKLLVDKYPLNISQVVLIRWLFPGASLLFSLRHPYDVCLSCFMQNFRPNDAMVNFFDLERTTAFYVKVMNLWQTSARVLPIDVHTVRYERLVEDLESEVRLILDFLGLEWDDRVLQYSDHARGRSRIDTPSYFQVVQPIYDHAKYRWRNYERQLGPVVELLEPFVASFGYR